MNDRPRTPGEVAQEAKTLVQEAMEATSGIAHEAKVVATATEVPVSLRMEDAQSLAAEAADTAKGLAADLADLAGDALTAVGTYSSYVVDVATSKLNAAKAGLVGGRVACENYVKTNPVRASLIAAAAGAIVTRLLLLALTSRSSRKF